MTTSSWKRRCCRSMPHPLFPRRTTLSVHLSAVSPVGRASSRRFDIKKNIYIFFEPLGSSTTVNGRSVLQLFKCRNVLFMPIVCRKGEIVPQRQYQMEIQPTLLKCLRPQRTSVFQRILTSLPCLSFVSLVQCVSFVTHC